MGSLLGMGPKIRMNLRAFALGNFYFYFCFKLPIK